MSLVHSGVVLRQRKLPFTTAHGCCELGWVGPHVAQPSSIALQEQGDKEEEVGDWRFRHRCIHQLPRLLPSAWFVEAADLSYICIIMVEEVQVCGRAEASVTRFTLYESKSRGRPIANLPRQRAAAATYECIRLIPPTAGQKQLSTPRCRCSVMGAAGRPGRAAGARSFMANSGIDIKYISFARLQCVSATIRRAAGRWPARAWLLPPPIPCPRFLAFRSSGLWTAWT